MTPLDQAFEDLAKAFLVAHPEVQHEWRDVDMGRYGDRRDLICGVGEPNEVFASLSGHQITVGRTGAETHDDFEDFGRQLTDAQVAQEAFERFVAVLGENDHLAQWPLRGTGQAIQRSEDPALKAAPRSRIARASHTPRGNRHTMWVLVVFYALAVVWGFRGLREGHSTNLDWLVPLAGCIALAWWAIVDARLRGRPVPPLSRPWVFLFAGVVVPCYVIWTRRLRGVAWLALHGALWTATVISVWLIGSALFPNAR